MASRDPKKPQETLPDWRQKLEEFRKKLQSDDKTLQEAAKKIVKGDPSSRGR